MRGQADFDVLLEAQGIVGSSADPADLRQPVGERGRKAESP